MHVRPRSFVLPDCRGPMFPCRWGQRGAQSNSASRKGVRKKIFWVCVTLGKEEELPFRLGDELAPEAEGERAGRATEDGDEVVFPELDRFFSDVAPVVVRGNKLVGHAGVCDGGFLFCGRFVV